MMRAATARVQVAPLTAAPPPPPPPLSACEAENAHGGSAGIPLPQRPVGDLEEIEKATLNTLPRPFRGHLPDWQYLKAAVAAHSKVPLLS